MWAALTNFNWKASSLEFLILIAESMYGIDFMMELVGYVSTVAVEAVVAVYQATLWRRSSARGYQKIVYIAESMPFDRLFPLFQCTIPS